MWICGRRERGHCACLWDHCKVVNANSISHFPHSLSTTNPYETPLWVFGIKITKTSQNTCGECVWNVCSSSYLLIPVSSEYLISWMKCSGISSIIRSPRSPGAAAEQQCFWEALKTWADGQVKINSGAEGKLISLLQHSETWWIILPSCHKNITHFTRFYY